MGAWAVGRLETQTRRGGRVKSLLWWEPIWIGLLAPSVLFPGRFWAREWHPILVALLFLFWPLHLIWNRQPRWRTPVQLALLAAAIWPFVSTALVLNPSTAWEMGGYVALGIALCAALTRWPPLAGHPQRVAWLYLALCGGLALVGPFLVGMIPPKFPLLPTQGGLLGTLAASVGETVNPNVLASALAPAAPLALAVAIYPGRSMAERIVAALLALILVGTVILSQSRGAYAATALGCIVVVMLRGRWAAITGLAIIAAGAAALWANQELWVPLTDYVLLGLDRRMQIWQRAAYALRDFPLTGLGFGHFAFLAPILYPYFFTGAEAATHAHNLFLQIGVDMGLPGLAAIAVIWIGVIYQLVRVLRMPASAGQHALAVGTLAALIALWTHGMVEAAAWSSKVAFLPWLIYAVAISVHQAQSLRIFSTN